MNTRFFTLSLAIGVSALLFGHAHAAPPNQGLVCSPEAELLDGTKWLRAVSLDLRGDLPTMEEYRSVRDETVSVEAMVDNFVEGPGFAERVGRHHRQLLWNNVSNVTVLPAPTSLGRDNYGGGSYSPYFVRNRATAYRGLAIPCLDEPAVINDGVIETTMNADGTRQEGYVWVSPYWAPTTSIKVCAYDAQEREVTGSGFECAAGSDVQCGCGTNLKWCRLGPINQEITSSLTESLDRLIADILASDRPYTDLFTADEMWINGRLAHFFRHQVRKSAPARLSPSPVPTAVLPSESDLAYTDADTWVKVPLESDHAGILTHPAFLLRFQTRRARANQMYNSFLCQPFQPPAEGLPPATDVEQLNPDLQRRAGCKYCHALLEPAAAFWGRWAENGGGFLNPASFPPTRDDCLTCATTNVGCSTECNRYYQTSALSPAEVPFLGMLGAYTFLDEAHVEHVEAGPSMLALRHVADNRLPECIAEKSAEWLFGRVIAPTDRSMVQELAVDFVASGFSYKELVKAIVTSDVYRRVR